MDFSGRKALSAGVDDYKEAASACYVVDKTLLIKDLLDSGSEVTIFTRPKGFGKSLNLSMIRAFFEKTDTDTSDYFRNSKIWQCGSRYTEKQGRYPVIAFSFRNVRRTSCEDAVCDLKNLISGEYARFRMLVKEAALPDSCMSLYQSILDGTAPEAVFEEALLILSLAVEMCCGVKPVVLVDDYDAPLQAGGKNRYYDSVAKFLGNFLLAGLKTNGSISFAVLTGGESGQAKLINGILDNANVYTARKKRFSGYFGFTKDEARELLSYYGCKNEEEALNGIDSCRIGDCEMLCPVSVFSILVESTEERLSRI